MKKYDDRTVPLICPPSWVDEMLDLKNAKIENKSIWKMAFTFENQLYKCQNGGIIMAGDAWNAS